MSHPPRLERQRIAMFSTADWDTLLPTNKHHLARRLARRNRVLFVETLGTRAPKLTGGTDLRRIGRRLSRTLRGAVRREPHLFTVSPLVRPRWSTEADIAINRRLFSLSCGGALAAFRGGIAWVYSPFAIHLRELDQFRLVIYHCVDDLSAVPGADVEALLAAEARLFSRADLVFCTERSLFQRAQPLARRVHFMPNVADYARFSNPQPQRPEAKGRLRELRELRRPLLLFSGHLASHKVDVELLLALARQRQDWSFVLIGPQWEADPQAALFQRIAALRNVTMLGHVPYEDLPPLLHAADVLLIPYALTDATRAVFPLKLFEYFATGRPVVASAEIPSLQPYRELAVLVDRAPDAWESAIRAALEESPERALRRQALARRNTWDERLREMEALILEVDSRR